MRRFDATRAARVCFKGAAEIESSLKALADSERALLAADDEAGRAAAVRSPALVIVGEVAALAAELHWFGSAPVAWRAQQAVA
jgi:uroporphyrin-III C-methyltransferase/precorrin-2 dehydrogenase/sirohydrochlorin ferrochelatase